MHQEVKDRFDANGQQSANMMLTALALAASYRPTPGGKEALEAVTEAIKEDMAEKLSRHFQALTDQELKAMDATRDEATQAIVSAFKEQIDQTVTMALSFLSAMPSPGEDAASAT